MPLQKIDWNLDHPGAVALGHNLSVRKVPSYLEKNRASDLVLLFDALKPIGERKTLASIKSQIPGLEDVNA